MPWLPLSPVVLIDVSEPTENLVWEVESLRSDPDARWVLIGGQARLEALIDQQAGAGTTDPVSQRLATLLDGETVLAYRSGRRPMRRFARCEPASTRQPELNPGFMINTRFNAHTRGRVALL